MRTGLAALALLFVLAGCGGGGAEGEDSAARTTEGPGEITTTTRGAPDCAPTEETDPRLTEGIPECELPDVVYQDDAEPTDRVRALADAARDHGLTETADALADGEVTVAEHRQAVQSALDCMTGQGMEVLQFEEYEGLYGTDFTFIIGWGALPESEASVVSTNCEARYRTTVQQAHDILTAERFTERAKEVLQDCLAEYGVTDDVGDTMDELREVVPSREAELDCVDRAEGTPDPPADLPTQPTG